MRVAVCLSGQVRCLGSNFQSIWDNLIAPTNADVFCHFWDSGPGGRPRAEEAINKFQPKLYEIENQIDFFKYPGKGNTPLTRSQYYSVKKANNLKKRFESQNNFLYDFVVRTRLDLVIERPFDVEFFSRDPQAIYALTRQGDKIEDGKFVFYPHHPELMIGSWKFLDDMFLVANSTNMDLYAMTYDYIDELAEIKKEEIFGTFIDGQRVSVQGASISGETAMIYNHNKNLLHLNAIPTNITREFRMAVKDAL